MAKADLQQPSDSPLMVRLTSVQRARLARAADIESRRRRVPVGESTLLREFGMDGVDELLSQHEPAQPAA